LPSGPLPRSFEFPPPSTWASESSPRCPSCDGLPLAFWLPHQRARSVLVVSHHLDGCSLRCLAGLLHPATDHGVRKVSACRLCCPALPQLSQRPLPPYAVPLEELSSLEPYRVTAASMPPCRYVPSSTPALAGQKRPVARLRGFAPELSSVPPHHVAAMLRPCPSLGL
jgi:hypothetical protein